MLRCGSIRAWRLSAFAISGREKTLSKRKRSEASKRKRLERYLFIKQRKTAVEYILSTAFFDFWRGEKICMATLPEIQFQLSAKYGVCLVNDVPFQRGLVLANSRGNGCEQNGELTEWATVTWNLPYSGFSSYGNSENAKTITEEVKVMAENGGEGGESAQCQ